MKVYIGPYKNWVGPYQIADMLFFWHEKWVYDSKLDERWDYKLKDKLGTWLSNTWVNDFCQWLYDKQERKVKVHIDNYDTWSADHTLSLIIVPLLKRLQEVKHGSPVVDDADVPEELRSTSAPPVDEYETDDNHHKRWDWAINEMIWAFEQQHDEQGDMQFYHDKEPDENGTPQFDVDRDGLKAWQERKANGYRLFGKYYENLWD